MKNSNNRFQDIEKVIDLLPQRNCGRCGFVDCHEYAAALIKRNASLDQCRRLNEKKAREISRIISRETIEN